MIPSIRNTRVLKNLKLLVTIHGRQETGKAAELKTYVQIAVLYRHESVSDKTAEIGRMHNHPQKALQFPEISLQGQEKSVATANRRIPDF